MYQAQKKFLSQFSERPQTDREKERHLRSGVDIFSQLSPILRSAGTSEVRLVLNAVWTRARPMRGTLGRALDRAPCGSRAHRGRCASGARASICDAGPRVRASCSPGHRAPCAGGGCTPSSPDCGTGASARGCAAAGVRPSLALWPPRVAAVQVTRLEVKNE